MGSATVSAADVNSYACQPGHLKTVLIMNLFEQAIVDVCDKLLAIEVPNKYESEITLPFDVDDSASDAAFDR
jgi:hypothetical protein